jgi:hypothetical protein
MNDMPHAGLWRPPQRLAQPAATPPTGQPSRGPVEVSWESHRACCKRGMPRSVRSGQKRRNAGKSANVASVGGASCPRLRPTSDDQKNSANGAGVAVDQPALGSRSFSGDRGSPSSPHAVCRHE